MKKKHPLQENYERFFGKINESNYFNDDVQFGIKVSLRDANTMSYIYRDVLKSLGIVEEATDQYIANDEDSFFDMMYAIIENGVDPAEFVEVVINGNSMSGEKFIKQYGDEFGAN